MSRSSGDDLQAMVTTPADDKFEFWERRLSAVARVIPYVLLAAGAALAVLTGDPSPAARLIIVGLAALAAGWMWWMVTCHPGWTNSPVRMAVYYAGLLVFIALLMQRSPWFGLFAFTGYLHAWRFLPGAWRLVGVTLTAIISVTWQTGGPPQPTAPGILSYLVILVITITLVSIFSYMGEITAEQNRQRKQVIAELEEANRRLAQALEENAALQAQLVEQAREAGVQDERQRLAGEIHDTLAQNLVGIIRLLETADRKRAGGEGWQRELEQASELARESLLQARRSVQALRPQALERDSLVDALSLLARSWSESTGMALQFEVTGTPQPLLAEIEDAIFRVAQEALANAAKHSRAKRVGLTLSYLEDLVLLDVRDDGVGFSLEEMKTNGLQNTGHGYGLHLMEQRLKQVAGRLQIESAPGDGTAVNASVPAIPAEEGYRAWQKPSGS